MSNTKKLTPFGYFGGKYALSDKIIPLFPEHRTYVEVFGGSGVVLINKKPSDIEVYNDLNEDVYNFYKVLNDKKLFKKFKEKVSMLPYSRRLYYEYRNSDLSALSLIDRAVAFYYLIKLSMNANMDDKYSPGWKFSIVTNVPKRIKNGILKLDVIHDRLSDVYIDNLDFRDLIKNWDRPDTFFYLDPPYVLSSRRGGAINMRYRIMTITS
ncbi:MAG: DNA adenine methylase [bacterium]